MSTTMSALDGLPAFSYLAVDLDPPMAPVRLEQLTPSQWLAIVDQMLSTLETLTIAGQRHTMEKIAGLIEQHAADFDRRRSDRSAGSVAHLVATLADLCRAALPDVATFNRHAKGALVLLARVGHHQELTP